MNETLVASERNTRKGQAERGILFTAPMVRAILDGRKTQTRRILKKQPTNLAGPNFDGLWSDTIDPVVRYFGCPYGVAGDRLWVRETWSGARTNEKHLNPQHPMDVATYRADAGEDERNVTKWTPSIHMPRWASRITLEITGVRVERVQEISEKDAKAEGVVPTGRRTNHRWRNGEDFAHRLEYRQIWNSINGKAAWEENPFVWVLEFTPLPQLQSEQEDRRP